LQELQRLRARELTKRGQRTAQPRRTSEKRSRESSLTREPLERTGRSSERTSSNKKSRESTPAPQEFRANRLGSIQRSLVAV
jgi:hypothetical protein